VSIKLHDARQERGLSSPGRDFEYFLVERQYIEAPAHEPSQLIARVLGCSLETNPIASKGTWMLPPGKASLERRVSIPFPVDSIWLTH
jgi:hypothetical protein